MSEREMPDADRRVIKGVLFDKDGTLLDFEATWAPATKAVIAALCERMPERAPQLSHASGFDAEAGTFHAGSPIIAGDLGAFAPAWADALGVSFDEAFIKRVEALYRIESARSLTGYDDVAEGLDFLRESGLGIGLATNDSEAGGRAHLEALGILDRFDFIAGYDSGHGAKPLPGMVTAFAAAIGAAPEEVILVGDSPHDMDAAKSAGAKGIGIARTPAAAEALLGHADVVVADLQELRRYLSSFAA